MQSNFFHKLNSLEWWFVKGPWIIRISVLAAIMVLMLWLEFETGFFKILGT